MKDRIVNKLCETIKAEVEGDPTSALIKVAGKLGINLNKLNPQKVVFN